MRFPRGQTIGILIQNFGKFIITIHTCSSEDADLVAEKENFDFSQFFNGKLDLATLLPSNNGNEFVTDRFVDPTMGGMLPDWTQKASLEELYSEEFIKMKPIFNGTISNNGMQTFFVKEDGSLWGMGENFQDGHWE